jgi:hypothetical protein
VKRNQGIFLDKARNFCYHAIGTVTFTKSKQRMFEIIPIGITTVDWATLAKTAQKALGFTLDRKSLKSDLARFLTALGEMSSEDGNGSLSEAGSLLRHASASFICVLPAEMINQLKEEVDLAINSSIVRAGFRLCIVSGNMQQWREAIINCSSTRLPTEIRMLCNQFMMYFEQLGLGPIWAGYSKTTMSDNTFRLKDR